MEPVVERDRGAEEAGTVIEGGSARRGFLRAAGGLGALGAASGLIAACGGGEEAPAVSEDAKASRADLEILNYALMLEHLESDFYARVAKSGKLRGPAEEATTLFAEHEREHVKALSETIEKLGGKPAAKPKARFPELRNEQQILTLAAMVENLGAAAYLGQANRIQSKDVLEVALSIHTVEARHAAALNLLLDEAPVVSGPFAKPAGMSEVMRAIKPFLAS